MSSQIFLRDVVVDADCTALAPYHAHTSPASYRCSAAHHPWALVLHILLTRSGVVLLVMTTYLDFCGSFNYGDWHGLMS